MGKKAETLSCDGDDWLVVGEEEAAKRRLDAASPNQMPEGPQELPSESESDSTQMPQNFQLFQLLVWHSGLEEPLELVDENQKPLLMAADTSSSMADVQEKVWETVLTQPQLRGVFPQVTRENVRDAIQVCKRSGEMSWLPFETLTDEEFYCTQNCSEEKLQLTSHLPGEQWTQLLVESRFQVLRGGELTDWRRGRFYSDIQKNVWRFQLQIGQVVDAMDTDKRWYESRVVDMDAVYVKVHYRGWTSKWDEWLRRTSGRLAPLHTKVSNWRAFQVGDEVMVGSEVPGKKYPEWRNACVTACDKEDGLLQIEVEIDGKKKWLDAQDELVCPKGTHKAVNAGGKVASEVVGPPSLLFNYFKRPEEASPPRKVVSEIEVNSMRDATLAMHLAGSDAGGDEWCVVDDDEQGAEATATSNQTDAAVARSDTTESVKSDSSSTSAGPTSDSDELSPHSIISPSVGQIFATKVEILDGQIDTTISEEDAWRYQLHVDQLIDARDTDNKWYESRVVALSSTLVKLHYRGWTSKWDEWIERTSTRIAPLHTKVRNWRDFKVGHSVMVGRDVARKAYPEWRIAIVTACEACEVDGRLRIQVDVDGVKQWMDAQDEMLCPPGTHKAVNSSILKHMAPLF